MLDGLDAASVAALVSCITYEHRSAEAPPPPCSPPAELQRRVRAPRRTSPDRLNSGERAVGLTETREPEPGFSWPPHGWASGQSLDQVLDDDLTGGDFVRNSKQLIDLLRQLGDRWRRGPGRTARACRQAAEALHRGVVDGRERAAQ